MATKLYIEADVSKLINGIDKAADSIEDFGSRGEDAIKDLNKSFDSMSEKQKRSFEASKKSFDERIKKIKELEAEYEVLRRKQANNGKLNDEEIKRLRQLSKEYKDCKGSLATSSRELTNMAKRFREAGNSSDKLAKNLGKVVSAENKIKTKTPQVTHQFTELKTETLALVAAMGLSADALISMGVEADRQLSKLNAMIGSTEVAKRAYYEMADAQRYLGIEADIFEEYYAKLTKVTGSAKTAAYHLKLMGDAAAHAGMRDQQFDQMIDQLEIIQANGFFTDTNIELLEEVGLTGVKKALEDAFNVPYEQISKSRGQEVYTEIIKWFEKAFAGSREIQNDSITGIFSEISHDIGQIAHEIGKIFLDDLGLREFFKSFSDGSKKFVEELRKMNYGVQSFREAMNNTFGETATNFGYGAVFSGIGYGALEATTSIYGLIQAHFGLKKTHSGLEKLKEEIDDVSKKPSLVKINMLKKELEELGDIDYNSFIANMMDMQAQLNYSQEGENLRGLELEYERAQAQLREYLRINSELAYHESIVKNIGDTTKETFSSNNNLLNGKAAKEFKTLNEAASNTANIFENTSKTTTSSFKRASDAIKKYKLDTIGAAADVGGTLADLAGTTNKNMSRMGFFAAWKQGFIALGAAAKACFAAILTPITGITVAIAALAALADNLYNKYKDADFGSLLEHAMRGEDLPESEAVKQALEGLKVKEKEVQFQKTLNKLSYNSQGLMDAHNKELNKKISRTNQLAKVSEEAAKAAEKQRKEEYAFAKENLARTQYAENYSLALAAKANADRLNNDIEYYANLESLMQGFGAVEKSLDNQRLKNKNQLAKDLFEVENNYATQLKSLQDRLALKELDLSNASTANEKSLIKKDIKQIKKEITDLNLDQPKDVLKIKVRADVTQLTTDLQEAVRKQSEKNSGLSINPRYQESISTTLDNFQSMAKKLAEAKATGGEKGMASMMSIGQLLGMSTEEILAKGSAIEQVYATISNAMVNASAKEIQANKDAKGAAEDLAKFRQNYMNGLAQGFGDMFADWASGAKSAKEAFGDFARGIIQEVVAMIAKLTALYLLMLACGYGGKAFANAKFLTFGSGSWQGKAKGGYITGPGTSRSDSIPAMLSNGEYVLNAAAVNAIGVHRLDQMNKGYLPKFADGGLVGKSNASQPVVSPTVNLTVSALDASSFDNFLRRGGLDKIKQAFYSDNLKFASNAGVF